MNYLLALPEYVAKLRADRRELLEYSKGLGGLAERRAARAEFFADLAAANKIFLSPKPGQDPKDLYRVDADGVAHINIIGQLTPQAEQDVCGGYTAQALTEYGHIIAATQAAQDDTRVQSIDYHVDSPGGYVSGVDETAQVIAASKVPTRAIVSGMAASAAYWLASQTDQIIATTPAAQIGSIGVLAEEFNADRAMAEEGIDHRVYTSTDAPLKHADTSTPEGRAQIVAGLDALHAVFVGRVAEGRGVSVDKVNADFGKGAVLVASAALSAGMIDAIQGENIGRRAQHSGVAAGPSQAIKPKGSKKMTLEQLKAEHPDAYAQAVALGRADGIKAEQDRFRELSAWTEGHNADTVKIANEAIHSGKTFAEVQSQLMSAAAKGPRQLDGANPPSAATATSTPSGLSDLAVEGLSDADVQALLAGNPKQGVKAMTIDEIRANVPRKEA